MMQHLLTAIIFVPALGSVISLLWPSGTEQQRKDLNLGLRLVALLTTAITFILSLLLALNFKSATQGIQFSESVEWISTLRIGYLLGVDGLSVALIPLTALIFMLCVVASWSRSSGLKGYFSLFLFLETTTIGTFAAQDLFLFFSFWVASLLPIYFMIGVWGNKKAEYAATKFFLYQLAGSALLLLGMLAIYYSVEPHSFSLADLAAGKFSQARIDVFDRSLRLDKIVFVLMLVGIAVRIPVVPFHSWFPHVQAEAPPALAAVLAAVFIKTGGYALVRINYSLFPEAASWMSQTLAMAGAVNIIYGGACAMAQRDIRRLAAYSTISQIGLVLLGLAIFTSTAFHGAILQLISHGVFAALLFLLIGILGERSGEYDIVREDGSPVFGGLVSQAPMLTGFFTVAVFSALGIPGLGMFLSQSLVFLGVFPHYQFLTVVGLLGVLLTAGYLLWTYRRLFLGQVGAATKAVSDITILEQVYLIPLLLLSVFVGAYPTPLINLAQPTIDMVLMALSLGAR